MIAWLFVKLLEHRHRCLPERHSRIKAFTLIELMVVIAIIGILASIAVPSFAAYRERAMVAVCITDIGTIAKEITVFAIDNNRFPDTLAEAGWGGKLDPWGNPYRYLKIAGAEKNLVGNARKDRFMVPINTDFDLYSMGPDGMTVGPLSAPKSQDDIIRANDGGFVGRASNF